MTIDTIQTWLKRKNFSLTGLYALKWGKSGMIALCMVLTLGLINTQNAYSQAEMINEKGIALDMAQDGPQTVATQDSLALVALYYSMNGDRWRSNAGWLVDPVVTWDGVNRIEEIDGEWRITRMGNFSDRYNMVECGYLSPEIGDLTYLERWDFPYQFFCGELPNELFQLEYLDRFGFRGSYLTGEIRWDLISQMPLITDTRFEQNWFEGPVMTEHVKDLSIIQRITMSENPRLTGEFPPEVAQMTTLQRADWDNLPRVSGPWPDFSGVKEIMTDMRLQAVNFDPGPLPEWIKDMEVLETLYFQENNREGMLPEWILEMETLETLKFGGKTMGGDMADMPNLSFLPNLSEFRIRKGSFTGEIPEWYGFLESVQRMWIMDTDIGGELPGNVLRELTGLELLWFSGNQFTGGLPPELTEMTSLTVLDLSYNNLEIGDLPDFIGDDMFGLQRLKLAGGGITGEIPANWSNMDAIAHISLADNPGLTGDIPQWMKERNWQQFDISHTGLDLGTSEFPEWVQSMTDLYKLGLAGLGISGSIPDWLGNMLFLRTFGTRDLKPYIDISHNNLSGPIPESMGNLYMLDSLNLSNNQLTGGIEMLADVGRPYNGLNILHALDVSGNPDLEGEIPMAFTDARDMRVFKFDGTKLCEPDNDEFRSWLASIPENGQMRWPYTEVSTSGLICDPVSAGPSERVYTYRLSQNYPNPFNPATTIQYEIPVDVHVTLNVYNVIGQRVSTLVNESVNAGQHTVTFDGSSLASGTYIYRLEAGDRVLTQTMMMIK